MKAAKGIPIAEAQELSNRIVKQADPVDNAGLALRDIAYELGPDSSIGEDVLLAAHLCRLAREQVVEVVRELNRRIATAKGLKPGSNRSQGSQTRGK